LLQSLHLWLGMVLSLLLNHFDGWSSCTMPRMRLLFWVTLCNHLCMWAWYCKLHNMHLELVFKHVKYVIAGGRRQRWKDGTLCSAAGWSSRCVCEWCIWILAASCVHLPHHKVLAFICWTLHAGTVPNCNQEDSEWLNKENCIACKAFEHIVRRVYVDWNGKIWCMLLSRASAD
jgi:hypothetical protein